MNARLVQSAAGLSRLRLSIFRKPGIVALASVIVSTAVAVTPTPVSGSSQPTFVQATASTSKTKIAFVNPVAAGDLLVAAITTNDGGTDPITGVSDNLNGAWTKLASQRYGNGHVDMYYRGNSVAGAITVTFAGPQASFAIGEYAGVQATANPVDQFAARAGSGSPSAGPTAAITTSGELVIGVGGNPAPSSGSTQFTAGTGFTLRTQAVSPWITAVGLEDELSTSSAGQSMTMKSANSSYYGAIVAAFKTTPAPAPKAALTVTPGAGAAPLAVTADASASVDPLGITSYAFAFGDGTTAGPQTSPTAGHTYTAGGTYTAQVTITDSVGATATATATVLVGAPQARLTVSPASGVTPFQVTANAATSTDPIGISTYTFNFGDGSALVGPQAAATARHTYGAAGSFTVSVLVGDGAGATSSATAAVTSSAPPTAALTVAPTSGQAPLGVTADASASTAGTNPIASYAFDFGDGTVVGPQTTATAGHTYAAGGVYSVKVTVLDTAGNPATATATVTVGAPAAALSVNPAAGGAPLTVTASATGSTDPIGITSYAFSFGDGSAAVGPQTTSSASHTYAAGGTYIVVVSVSDSAGAIATTSKTVTVGQPVAALTLSPSSGPAPLPVTADASSSTDPVAISTYTFDFGDGTVVGPQAASTATHNYVTGGSFTVRVTVLDVAGASATTTQTVTVGLPTAVVTASPNAGPAPLTVTANASGSSDPIGVATYTFNFGDGTPAVGPQATSSATHTYTSTGSFTVTVTVTDSVGGTTSATTGISVAVPPTAALSATPASGPAPLSVTADASASTAGTNPIASYTFDFGDGSAPVGPQASPTAGHLYSSGGHYTITVTVKDTIGVSSTATTSVTAVAPPTAAVSVSPGTGTIPLAVTADASASKAGSNPIATYTFDFGDGSAVVGPQASAMATHTYTTAGNYTVKVTVADTSATTATATAGVTAVAPPVSSFTLSLTSGAVPLPVTADGSGSSAGTNPIASYAFDFGDGTVVGPQASSTAAHTYTAGGVYTVTLTVKDTAGYSSASTETVTVGAPIARIQATPSLGATPLAVTADGSTSSDPIGITTYTFDFGDGTVVGPQTNPTAVHTYTTGGTFTVSLTVRDRTGASSSASAQVRAVTPPSASLMVSPGQGATPMIVTADASGSTPGTNPIASYSFDFGDGTKVGPQASATAQHTYTAGGGYVVRVTVTDTQGITAGATVSVTAVNPPSAKIVLTPPSGGVPLGVTLDASSSTPGSNPIATYQFNFGDGTPAGPPSSTASVTHTYTAVGTYTVSVVVSDTVGISSTASAVVTVVNPPNAVLTVTPGTGGAPLTVTADGSGSTDPAGIASYTFDFGDGSPVVGPQASPKANHVFATAGNFTVTVTVADAAQATAQATASVDVVASPAASLAENPISGYAPLSVIADASGSGAGSFPIASYTFNFGDGTPVVGPQANPKSSHVFVTPGSFTTVVTVTDTQGNSGTASQVINVASGTLVQDSFTRANTSGTWGTASNGAPWAPSAAALSIASNEGVINSSTGSSFELIGTATSADGNGLVRFSLASATDTVGVVLREQTNGNMYLGRYDGAGHLQFEYRVGTAWTHVSLVPFTPQVNTFYWLRFMVQGSSVNLKAWQYGTTEPAAWSWSGSSSGITSAGQMGLYGYAGSATPVLVDTFSVSAVGNPVPNSTITGTVTDVNTGFPVAGVQVSTLPLTTTATTNSAGAYSLNLPAGTFTVVFTAASVGYNANFVAGVQAPVNGTASANQSLAPIPAQTAMDTFTQPNQSNGFGTSTDGNVWANDFARYPSANAGITNSQAWVDTQASSQTDLDTWMGNQYQNQLVSADLNMNTILVDPVFQHGSRLLARVQNSTTWILMSINPTAQDLELWATLNDNWTLLVTTPMSISTNSWYHAKLAVIDNTVEGKIWSFGSAEPGWQISATQHIVNGAGQGGLRTTGAYVQYANFRQTAITQIAGVVTSASNGTPIAGATVSLSNGATAITDSSGSYTLTGLLGGATYTMTVSAPGKTQTSLQITTTTAQTTTVNVALGP